MLAPQLKPKINININMLCFIKSNVFDNLSKHLGIFATYHWKLQHNYMHFDRKLWHIYTSGNCSKPGKS